jgi:hypothetical protein
MVAGMNLVPPEQNNHFDAYNIKADLQKSVLWNARVQLSDIVTAVLNVDLPGMKDRTESQTRFETRHDGGAGDNGRNESSGLDGLCRRRVGGGGQYYPIIYISSDVVRGFFSSMIERHIIADFDGS